MPSTSLKTFEGHLLKDVHRLIESHGKLNHSGGGRRGLGHITRSGVLMLCGAWEVYMEDLLRESVEYVLTQIDDIEKLPKSTRKYLAKTAKNSTHELEVLKLAGDGWKNSLINYLDNDLRKFNTPKSAPLDDIYRRYLGIDNGISSCWSHGDNAIDEFVDARGDIAHGRGTGYITITKLEEYLEIVQTATIESDNFVATYTHDEFECKLAWSRRRI